MSTSEIVVPGSRAGVSTLPLGRHLQTLRNNLHRIDRALPPLPLASAAERAKRLFDVAEEAPAAAQAESL